MNQLPRKIEAEQSVIGGLMLLSEPCVIDDVFDALTPGMFFSSGHGRIYEHMRLLHKAHRPIDLVTVTDSLDSIGQLEPCGGFGYLGEIAKNTPSAANIRAYTDLVREAFYQREVLRICNDASVAILEGNPAEQVCGDLEGSAQVLSRQNAAEEVKSLSQYMGWFADELERRVQSNGDFLGLATGYKNIDDVLLGINPDDLVVIAARPSVGKTLFTQTICRNVALDQNKPVLFFSMEMSGEQISERFVSIESKVPPDALRKGELNEQQWHNVGMAMARIGEVDHFKIDDRKKLSINQIKAKARRTKAENPELTLIAVDYLGLADLPKADRHDLRIADFTRELKALAGELKTPVVLICQLNRNVDKAKGTRPQLSDLRDSGAIEQDADVVLMLHLEGRYSEQYPHDLMEVLFRKLRHNPANGRTTAYLGCVAGGYQEVLEQDAKGMIDRFKQAVKPYNMPKSERKKLDLGNDF